MVSEFLAVVRWTAYSEARRSRAQSAGSCGRPAQRLRIEPLARTILRSNPRPAKTARNHSLQAPPPPDEDGVGDVGDVGEDGVGDVGEDGAGEAGGSRSAATGRVIVTPS